MVRGSVVVGISYMRRARAEVNRRRWDESGVMQNEVIDSVS